MSGFFFCINRNARYCTIAEVKHFPVISYMYFVVECSSKVVGEMVAH